MTNIEQLLFDLATRQDAIKEALDGIYYMMLGTLVLNAMTVVCVINFASLCRLVSRR